MHVIRVVAGFVFLALVAGACQSPDGEATDAPTASPVEPVAPAVEPTHPDAERTIPLPSDAPVAPAVEPAHPDAERTIELPASFEPPASGGSLSPAAQPEPGEPDPTVEIDPG